MSERTGLFLSFEGIEGAGKSTQMARLGDWLRQAGFDPLLTREPGGTPFGERIRDIFLDPVFAPLDATEELLLVYAARVRHLRQIIEPALQARRIVLCDRYEDSSYAYQGGGRQIPLNRLEALSIWAGPLRQPDLTFWFDVDPAQGLARAGRRGVQDRLEQETLEFFTRARQVFAQRLAANPVRIVRINADSDEESVWLELLRHCESRVNTWT